MASRGTGHYRKGSDLNVSVFARRDYRFVEMTTRTSTHVVPRAKNSGLLPGQLHEQEYGDCGRKAALTRPYKPLGTPDHSVRDRRVGLPGRNKKKKLAASPETMHNKRWQQQQKPGNNNSMVDLHEHKGVPKRRMRGARGHKSLDNLKKYKRIGTKATGFDQLKDKINQSRLRMRSVRAGHKINTHQLVDAADVSSRAALELQWKREAEVAELLLQRRVEKEGGGMEENPDSEMAKEGMALLRRNLGRHYLPYHRRRPKTPYLVAPTVTQASVEASGSRTDVLQHKERQRANFHKQVSNFGRQGVRPVLVRPQADPSALVQPNPALKIERRCADYQASQKMLSQGLVEMLDHLEHERLVMLQRKQQALDYAVEKQLCNAKRVLPAIRFAAELERSREQQNSVQQAVWYSELMVEVLGRTRKRIIEEELKEHKVRGRREEEWEPPQINPLTLAKAIKPAVRFLLARVRQLTMLGRPMDASHFLHALKELRPRELRHPIVVFAVVYIARKIDLRDDQMQDLLARARLPAISFSATEESPTAGEGEGTTQLRGGGRRRSQARTSTSTSRPVAVAAASQPAIANSSGHGAGRATSTFVVPAVDTSSGHLPAIGAGQGRPW